MVKDQYTKIVDKNMCSALCPCSPDVESIWRAVPMNRTRESGRVAIDLMTAEESQEVLELGPYDAAITPMIYALPYIDNFSECYNENFKPMLEQQENLPEDMRNKDLETTMVYVEKFFESGGYDFLYNLEQRYSCASICNVPLFYLAMDTIEGPPEQDCFTAAVEELTNQKDAAILFFVTAVVLFCAMIGAFTLCCGGAKNKEEDEDRKRNY